MALRHQSPDTCFVLAVPTATQVGKRSISISVPQVLLPPGSQVPLSGSSTTPLVHGFPFTILCLQHPYAVIHGRSMMRRLGNAYRLRLLLPCRATTASSISFCANNVGLTNWKTANTMTSFPSFHIQTGMRSTGPFTRTYTPFLPRRNPLSRAST